MSYGDHDVEAFDDLDLMQIHVAGQPATWAGITRPNGDVYLQGDVHPLGSATALIKAAKEHVPYVPVSAVQVLFPADWLAGECLHDEDRLRVIRNLCAFVRGQ